MSRRGKNSADKIDFDFFDDGPNVSGKAPSTCTSDSVTLNDNRHSHTANIGNNERARTTNRHANSQQSSSRSSSEESTTRKNVKIAATVPRVEVEDDSDSSSDSDNGLRNTKTNGKGKEPVPGNSKSSDRSRSASRSSASRSRSASASSTDSASTTDSSKKSDSDSEMTDVSPLHSPKEKHNPNTTKKRVGINDTVYDMESQQPQTANRSRPVSGKSTSSNGSAFDKLMEADRDTINLDLLMQAIMEMEEDRSKTHKKINQQGVHNNPTSLNRKNMSFSNDRVKEIDRENQRLMRNIMKNATMVKKQQHVRKIQPVAAKNTPSAVNRMREQKRIEQENCALLRRLNEAKAHPNLQRDKQLDSFQNSKLYGIPMKAIHPSADGLKSSSYSSLEANFSSQTHYSRSRPSSAKAMGARPPSAKLTRSRPTSAKVTSGRPISAKSERPASAKSLDRPLSGKSNPRPAWDERW